MPVDSSIYFQQQAPDFLGNFQQGMSLRDAYDKRALQQKQLKEDEAIKNAFKSATTLGPNGELNFNQGAALGQIAQANPMKALEYKQQFAAQDAANLQKKREQMGFVSSLAGTIKDQQSLESALAQAKQYGIPVDGLPTVYDQSTAPVFQRIQMSALTAQQQLDNHLKQAEEARKAQESAANLAKTKAETAKINTEIKSGKGANQTITELRKERSGLPTTKDTQNISAAYNKIQAAASNPSAAGDLSLIFGYMKMLDPGSTVREGEFANAQNAAGLPAKVVNAYNNALNGQRLNPDQRTDFIGQAGHIYNSQLAIQKQIDSQYADLAIRAGGNPKDVLLNFEANKPNDQKNPGMSVPILKTSEIEW